MSIIKLVIYQTSSGKIPFNEWWDKLDLTTRAIIRTRINRVSLGNCGDAKIIKGGEGKPG